MSGFPEHGGALQVEQVGWGDGRPLWRLLAPLVYISAQLGATVVIPAGFRCDLASVPRVALTWLVAGGRAPRPAVVHDYAYQYGVLPLADGTECSMTRPETDALFAEAMAADPMAGTNAVTRWIMWAAVRLGGRGIWGAQEARQAALNPAALDPVQEA